MNKRFMILIVIGCAVVAFIAASVFRAHQQAVMRRSCVSNLWKIGRELMEYANAHNSQYPDDLRHIITTESRDHYLCPLSSKRIDDVDLVSEWTSYVLIPQRTMNDSADTVLMHCRHHDERSNHRIALHVDGRVVVQSHQSSIELPNVEAQE